jgi:hypothetical protein
MGKTDDHSARFVLAGAVAALAARLGPEEAARQAAAARHALKAMGKMEDRSTLYYLAEVVAALAPRLGPEEAAAAVRQALEAMGNTDDPDASARLARAVAALAPRLRREEAARQAAAAARQVLKVMEKMTHPDALSGPMGFGTGAIAFRLHKTTYAKALSGLVGAVRALAPRLGPEEAAAVARRAVEAIGKTNDPDSLSGLAEASVALLVQAGPGEISPRTDAVTVAIASLGDPTAGFAALAPLAEVSHPLPGRFSEQQLVDLLKMPTCQQPVRQVIVEQLGRQCNHPFADQWEFVAWAREHRPDLDLASPPVRPTPP